MKSYFVLLILMVFSCASCNQEQYALNNHPYHWNQQVEETTASLIIVDAMTTNHKQPCFIPLNNTIKQTKEKSNLINILVLISNSILLLIIGIGLIGYYKPFKRIKNGHNF